MNTAPNEKELKEAKMSNSLTELACTLNPRDISISPLSLPGTMMISNRYSYISNNRLLLAEMYSEHGIVQTFVDLPVDDAFRGGVIKRSGQLSPEEIEELDRAERRTGALREFVQAKKWARLFGGGAVLIITDQPADTPLKPLNQGDRLAFKAVDMWELYTDGESYKSDNQNNIEFADHISMLEQTEFFTYYGIKIHKSRVVPIKGITAPSLLRNRMRGWGVSVCEAIVRSINEYLKAKNLSYEVLDEFKVDVYKIKNLISSLQSSTGTNTVAKRIQAANMIKNFQNAIVMDADDDYQNKQLSFTGLAEMLGEIRMTLASDLRMPITKLFGVSASGAGGFTSSDNDVENYNAMVETTIRATAPGEYHRILDVLSQSVFGFTPDDLEQSYEPLRIMSAEQVEDIKDKKMARLMSAYSQGLISAEDCKKAINMDDLLGIEIEESDELFKPIGIGGAEEGDGKTPGLTNEKGQELAYHYKPSMWNAARYGLKRGLKRILK